MTTRKDKVYSFFEYLLVIIFILGAVSLIGAPPLAAEGIVKLMLGGKIAIYFYITWFAILSILLFTAKVFNRKVMHKNTLMLMYLTTIYTAIIATYISGFSLIGIVDDIIIGLVAGVCWLRWKFRTEYIDPTDFHRDIQKIRNQDDLTPPS